MKDLIGNQEIIKSGTIVAHGNEPIAIRITAEEENLSFVFEFNDNYEGEYALEMKSGEDSAQLKIALNNFFNPIGQTTKEPIIVASVGPTSDSMKDIYLSFVVYRIGESRTRIMHYTFYY